MAHQRVEVLWSPNNVDEFATYCTELRLHSVQEGEAGSATDLPLSPGVYGKLIGSLPSNITCMPQHKSVAWQSNSHCPYHFAIGQSSGKVLLVQYSGSNQPHPPSVTTLSPRNGRVCTCVCWNPTENQLLAVGLDKARNDSSLVVWDVTRVVSGEATPPERARPSRFGEGAPATEETAKILEFGHGEVTSSVVWLPSHSTCLVAGMGNRFLRIFDTRDEHAAAQTRPTQYANHKAILGLSVCPSLPHQLASYAEGSSVYIWDVRQFSKPVYSFTRSATIERLSWLPTHPGSLSIVTKEPPYLHLVDIPSLTCSSDMQQDMNELFVDHLSCRMTDRRPYLDTKTQPYKKLIAVEWHSKRENIALITNITGQVKQFQVHDKMALAWNASNSFMYSSSEKLICAVSSDTLSTSEMDISEKIKRRVAKGYGFNPATNVKLLKDDPVLQGVWAWLKSYQELSALLPSSKGKSLIPGVCSALAVDSESSHSRRQIWTEVEGVAPSEAPPFPIYQSPQRQLSLQLCGWSFATAGHSLEDFIKREELGERYERAAAVAVFQGHLRRGITSLTDGATEAKRQGDKERASQLHLIALALSGYSANESRLWHEMCLQLRLQIRQPYLRAVFNFLSSTGRDDFKDVTNEVDISLQDRIAFMCTYLEDSKLHTYVSHLTKQLVSQGDISALFLTGLTHDGLSLLSNYVNQTGDVQTACLIAGQVMPFAIKDKRVQAWFQGYRDLLDQWQMWHERAIFDSQRKQLDASFKPPRQASVTCHFCSKSITGDSLRQDRRGPHASARKSSSCPSCRKPLPRCALCLLNMVATGSRQPRDNGSGRNLSDQFGQWFTWCQSCRHGGHAHHIAQWFSSHQECPVTGCACHCFALDVAG